LNIRQAGPSAPETVSQGLLDEFQTRFIQSPAGNLRLLAPAGSGKTQSLLWRCAELHKRLDGKAKFLVVTFTRAARDELRARSASSNFAAISDSVDVVTLNGWGFKRVRTNHHRPQLIATEGERSRCVHNTLQPIWRKHPSIAAAMASRPYVVDKVLMNLIDLLKSLGFNHESDAEAQANDQLDRLAALGSLWHIEGVIDRLRELEILADRRLETFVETIVPFWAEATSSLIEQATFTLEDQKYVAFLDVRRQIAEARFPAGGARTTHILVDEFQDINPLDLALIKQIADLHRAELTLVGDDDQAVFEWRGATPNYILHPERHFDRPFATYILEKNYRCPRNLVRASQKLIVHNRRREPKNVVPMRAEDAEVEVIRKPNFTQSIDAVMDEVRAFLRRNAHGAKLAILSRKRAQIIPYQIIMASEDLPFCAAEDLSVFLSGAFDKVRQAVQVCAMARAGIRVPTIVDDIVRLCDLVKRFPLKKIERDALAAHLRAARPKSYAEGLESLEGFRRPLKGPNEDGALSRQFASAIRKLIEADTVRTAVEALDSAFEGLDQDYGRSQEDIFFADPPFLYLAAFAERYTDDFQRFLDDLERARDTLVRLPGEDDESAADELWRRPVHLMTALRAKGKEFDTVIILDANDGIWPLRRAESAEAKEGERRLFYVAITRAKRRLVVTLSGRIGDQPGIASPYLAEADLV
jgi:DNA helicase-2/ATP-dependent DNA helicase PcrA